MPIYYIFIGTWFWGVCFGNIFMGENLGLSGGWAYLGVIG